MLIRHRIGPAARITGEVESPLWAGTRRLGAALAGPDGRFHQTTAPRGAPPEPGHINPTNRDLRTGGRYALFAWEDRGLVRISVRRF